MVVIGAGTCGTLTGVARKIKERQPKCKVSGLYIKHDREDVQQLLLHVYINIKVSLSHLCHSHLNILYC